MIVNVPVDEPAAIGMDCGTPADVSDDRRVTVAPPVGAGAYKPTVAVATVVLPPTTLGWIVWIAKVGMTLS